MSEKLETVSNLEATAHEADRVGKLAQRMADMRLAAVTEVYNKENQKR